MDYAQQIGERCVPGIVWRGMRIYSANRKKKQQQADGQKNVQPPLNKLYNKNLIHHRS